MPWWLLFNKLKNKVCHYSLIITQFRDRHIQVKNNETVDSGSLKGDCVHYIQVTALCGMIFGKFSDCYTQGDHYIRGRYIQARL